MTMAAGLHAATDSTNDRTDPASGTDRGTTRQITIRSTQMSHLLHEDLARAHLEQRLAQAERQRLANYVLRVARARRQARRAGRQLDRAQLRLRLLNR
jgi:hypothetical protein